MQNKNKAYNQFGMANLLIILIILISSTLIVLYTSRDILLNQKIIHSQYRNEQATHFARAKLYELASVIMQSRPEDIPRLSEDNTFNNSHVKVLQLNHKDNYFFLKIQVYSEEHSLHQSAQAVLGILPLAGNGNGVISQYPLVVYKRIINLNNMILKNSKYPLIIRSGGSTQLQQVATFIPESTANTNNNNNANNPQLSPKLRRGSLSNTEIKANDPVLGQLSGDQFFQLFIHERPEFVRQFCKQQQNYLGNNQFSRIQSKQGVIWYGEGNDNLDTYDLRIGSLKKPVLLILDSGANNRVSTHGELNLYGLLYIRGNWLPMGKTVIHGAVIVQGNIEDNSKEYFSDNQIIYQNAMLKPAIPWRGTMAIVPGSIMSL